MLAALCAPAKSLGDFAQEQRAKQSKEVEKPVRVFTNDDFSAQRSEGQPSDGAAPSADAHTVETEETKTPSSSIATVLEVHDEEYYRDGMEELLARLEKELRLLDALQDELAEVDKETFQALEEVSSDPRWLVNPVAAFWSNLSDREWLTKRIAAREQVVSKVEKAISDQVEQCRREGCRPNWVW